MSNIGLSYALLLQRIARFLCLFICDKDLLNFPISTVSIKCALQRIGNTQLLEDDFNNILHLFQIISITCSSIKLRRKERKQKGKPL